MTKHIKARLNVQYQEKIKVALQKRLNIANINAVPRLEKIVINAGVGAAVADSRALQPVLQILGLITGQAPIKRKARKSIAGFKIREGMHIGAMVTLRKERMYEFFDKLINIALPNMRDFQGVSKKLDGCGNYNLGIKDWSIFPEADAAFIEKTHGLNITICTTAKSDAQGYELLKDFGMPFVKDR